MNKTDIQMNLTGLAGLLPPTWIHGSLQGSSLHQDLTFELSSQENGDAGGENEEYSSLTGRTLALKHGIHQVQLARGPNMKLKDEAFTIVNSHNFGCSQLW